MNFGAFWLVYDVIMSTLLTFYAILIAYVCIPRFPPSSVAVVCTLPASPMSYLSMSQREFTVVVWVKGYIMSLHNPYYDNQYLETDFIVYGQSLHFYMLFLAPFVILLNIPSVYLTSIKDPSSENATFHSIETPSDCLSEHPAVLSPGVESLSYRSAGDNRRLLICF